MTLIDKKGIPFEVRSYTPEDHSYLEEMYDNFTPKGEFQGMPPRDKKASEKWIQGLVRDGKNFMAWQEGKVIGHVAVLPDFERGSAEYMIFVSQIHRSRGIGKELTLAAIQEARKIGLKTIWLTVDSYNFRATKLYKKIGFQFRKGYSSASERMMTLEIENLMFDV